LSPRHFQDFDKRADRSRGICCFMDAVASDAEDYAWDHTTPLSALVEEVERFTLTQTPYPNMLSGRLVGRLLALAAQLSGARRAVDIGTFTGYSALTLAEAMPDNGKVLTIEKDRNFAKIAQDFFDRSACGRKISLRIGEAAQILKTLPDEETDLIFIDADKRNYSLYYTESMRILRNGGLILADNALWYGRVLDPKDDESRSVADFNELVKADPRAEKLLLTIRDGVYLIRKGGP